MAKQSTSKVPVPKINSSGKAPTEIGDSAGIALNGIIVSKDYNYKFMGSRRVAIYDEMRWGDATVKATLLAIFLPILSARWRVNPASDDKLDVEVAEFVEKEIMDEGSRTWEETLAEILLYLVYGSMPFEIIWEWRPNRKLGLRKLSPRYPDTVLQWQLKNKDNGILQQTVNGTYEIPMEKLVVFVNQKEGENWEGLSILRSAYKHWYMKDKLYLIDAIGAERQGLGVPYAKATGVTGPADESKMEILLENLRANEKGYLVYPDGWEVGFLDMKAGTTKPLLPLIQHHDRQISKNVLAQFLELGGTVGSHALSADQSKLFVQSLEATARYIAAMYNRYVVKKLVDYNFIVDKYPTLGFDKIGTVDINALTTSLQRAVQTQLITPDPSIEKLLRDVMDLPEFTGEMPVDLTMADDMFAELDAEMASVTGDEMEEQPQEDPQNPGFDMEGNPMEQEETPEDVAQAHENLAESTFVKRYGSAMFKVFEAGPRGQPLSDEHKKKISEALKKLGGKGGKGKGKAKKKVNPAIKQKRAEIKQLNSEVRDFSNSTRRELLEMKAAGKKLSTEEQAKKQLDIFNKKTIISEKINKLKDEIDVLKSDDEKKNPPAPKADDKLGETLERINLAIDHYENETE